MNYTLNNEECILIGNKFAIIMQIIVAFNSILFLFLHKIFIENMYINYLLTNLKYYINFNISRKHITYYNYSNIKKNNYDDYINNLSKIRNWKTWFLDNLKQGASTSMSHIWGTYAAIKLSGKLSGDECGWFFLQFTIDTILGVLFAISFSKISIFLVRKYNYVFAFKWLSIGNYNNVPINKKYHVWFFQLLHWLLCSLIARILCTLILLALKTPNIKFVNIFSNSWNNNRINELIFVILIIPLILNTFQFIIQNIFLRWKRIHTDNNEFLLKK